MEYSAEPRYLSPTPQDVDISVADQGAKLLGYDLLPQGKQVATLLEANDEDGYPLYSTVAVDMARRNTKTHSIASVLLGRCLTRPGYKVISTAQDGQRAAKALKELMYALDACEPDSARWTLRWSNGDVAIFFANGSRWEYRTPRAAAFRGAAADCLWFDEAGEYDAETSEELVQGAMPLMATRPMGQLIVSGTPAPSRAGLLWDTIETARKGEDTDIGALDYGMTDADDPEDERVWYRVIPALSSGLVPIKFLRKSFASMSLPAFMTEWLCYWPQHAADRAIAQEDWKACAEALRAPDVTAMTLAMDVAPNGTSAALVAFWRDVDGFGHIYLQDHRAGTAWLPGAAETLLLKYPKTRLAYDTVANGSTHETVSIIGRNTRVASRVVPINMRDVAAGQAALVRAISAQEIRHGSQPGLNGAADALVWKSTEKGRWFGWHASKADITPMKAAAMALWDHDQNPRRKTLIIPNG